MRAISRGGACLAGCLLFGSGQVLAAENGAGFYLLGSRGPMAGVLPPPGLYLQNDLYRYSGSAGVSHAFPFNGQVVAGVDADIWLAMPTLLWSTPLTLLGGNLGLSVSQPLGGPSIDFAAELTGPLGNRFASDVHASNYTYGDPVLAAMLGWHRGNFHWQGGVALNVPIGDYDEDALANVAFNHWGADTFAALTWFDPAIGLDLSAATGVTFNASNPHTDYRSGNEFHLEWAAEQHFGRHFSAGLLGYHYRQLTDDSGRGANLGPFKGRARAFGVTAAWHFEVDRQPWSLRLKNYKEQSTENRLEGTATFITLSVPLSPI
ncbi:SphA family protein [Zestomonas carbonaria]|uniref:Phenol degradation protein meta n=1 Tax=Zestomonas carbonaria TaxID=2762745 RepID=A0A7U7ENQ9_9GAMM|nr:transporter [Pseudomonas carbonaria]CAD5108419.1 hypothetical protein PSEWESI4_02704 [Pseudomonas carbonaria]